MLVQTMMDKGRGPFRQALSQEPAGFLIIRRTGFAGRDGSVVEGGHLGGVVGDTKNQKTVVHQNGENGLAGELHAATPTAGGAEGATDLAIDLHPGFRHGLVPELFHSPGENPHVRRTAHGQTVAPENILGFGLVDRTKPHFSVGYCFRTFSDELRHAGGIASPGIEENKNVIHDAKNSNEIEPGVERGKEIFLPALNRPAIIPGMPNNETVFVTGTGTGAGKTVVTCLLTRALRAAGERVAALKPLCSGTRTDARRLRDAAGGDVPLDEVNPCWFRAPLTPLVAARQERRQVRLPELIEHVKAVRQRFDRVLVEGAGGLLSPLGEDFDARDLIVRLHAQVVVTGVNQLGVINQVLLTLECLPARFAAEARIVLVTSPRHQPSGESNIVLLRERLGAHRVKVLRRMTATERAGDTMKRAELIAWARWLTRVA